MVSIRGLCRSQYEHADDSVPIGQRRKFLLDCAFPAGRLMGFSTAAQDQKDLLQGQGVQETHDPQGHTVQNRKGIPFHNPRRILLPPAFPPLPILAADPVAVISRPPQSLKESDDTTVNSPGTGARRSPYSTKRQRRRRRWCYA